MVIVTGGSRGIGHAICKHIHAVSFSRTESDVPTIRCDVSDYTSVHDAFSEFFIQYGIPEGLVNCAGIVEPRPLIDAHFKEWKQQIDTNLFGAFLVSQQFARLFLLSPTIRRPGVIVNISSTAGMRPSPNWSAYGASKAGLINLSLTMAEELKPDIRVYTLVLGRCATQLRRKLAPDEDQSKIMQPEEVARFVEYLFKEKPPMNGIVTVSGT